MTAENRKVSVSEKGCGLGLSEEEGVRNGNKRLSFVLGDNILRAFTSQLSNDFGPFIAEAWGCWKPGPTK